MYVSYESSLASLLFRSHTYPESGGGGDGKVDGGGEGSVAVWSVDVGERRGAEDFAMVTVLLHQPRREEEGVGALQQVVELKAHMFLFAAAGFVWGSKRVEVMMMIMMMTTVEGV